MSRKINCNNCGSDEHALLGECFGNRKADFLDASFNVVVCKKCGLVFINPQPSEEELKKYYEKNNYVSKDGKRTYSKEKLIEENKIQEYYVRFLKKHVDPQKFPKVLDYGCGFGSFLEYLKNYGYQPEGLEPAEEIADRTAEIFGFPVYKQILRENDLSNEKYDIVTGIMVIEHSGDPLADLKEANRLLKNGGYVYLVTPDFEKIRINKGWNKYFKFVHTFYFTRKTLSSILNQAGFEVEFVWQIPSITKYMSLLYPENFSLGTLCIIAKKNDRVLKMDPYGDDPEKPFLLVKNAKKRDWKYIMAKKIIFSFYGLPLRWLRKIIHSGYLYEDIPNSPLNKIP